ncbi:phage head morphogenesis protein, partial [Paramuribaculum intestinale]|uniref:phage head morphogenesis protein n=2 Tax=Muribaculaceae TaxID=2005473 RepID=UPI0025B6CB5A
MMKSLFKEQGAQFRVELVADPAVQEFVNAHASALDSAFHKVEMSDAMRRRLTRSNYIFSGMKAFHELHEAFPSLLDENGNRKPFERFLNDVQSIDKTYNSNYLRAEYNFVAASAEMAGRWEQFMRDGERYNLQYRTQRDDKVRPEHAALDRVTLPPSDSFWEEFYPPNGWNCRCTVVQVRKSKYPETPHDEAMRLG